MSFMYTPCIPMQIKPSKSLSRQGTGPGLSFTERAAVPSLFLHRISIVCVSLSRLIHNAADTVGQCPCHSPTALRASSLFTHCDSSFSGLLKVSPVLPGVEVLALTERLRNKTPALTGIAQWTACGLRTKGLPVQFPVRAHA